MRKYSVEEVKEYVLKHFHYHPDGTITRDDRVGGLGSYDKDGYLILKIKGRQMKAHRIAWLLNYGEFPKSEIDHINRDKLDNRIENLRESNRFEQNRNKNFIPNKETGVVGIYMDHTKGLKKKYAFHFGGKTYRFRTIEEAEEMKKCLRN